MTSKYILKYQPGKKINSNKLHALGLKYYEGEVFENGMSMGQRIVNDIDQNLKTSQASTQATDKLINCCITLRNPKLTGSIV